MITKGKDLSSRSGSFFGGFTAPAQAQRQGLGFLQPFQFFAEGRLQAEEQNLIARPLRGAPTPARMIVKFLFGHGNSLFNFSIRFRSMISAKSCGRPAARFIFNSVFRETTGALRFNITFSCLDAAYSASKSNGS